MEEHTHTHARTHALTNEVSRHQVFFVFELEKFARTHHGHISFAVDGEIMRFLV